VASLLEASGLSWSRRSAARRIEDSGCDVILLDTIGELTAAYSLAEVAFVGGSIARHGGHNVLEPGARGICVITGPHTHNFAAVTKAMLDENAIVQLPNVPAPEASAQLAIALDRLLTNDSLRHDIGQNALLVCERNRGATERTLHVIEKLLTAPNTAGDSIPFPALPITAAK
jgi:3-deoxy-D-manno-octulosonic-acid transferase